MAYPYLYPAETPLVRAAFDRLFDTIQTRETDSGVEMYSRMPGEPVATLTGDELGAWTDIRDLTAKASSWYRADLIEPGVTVTMPEIGASVRFGRAGLGKVGGRKGDYLLRAVPALPQIIEDGQLISSEPDAKRGQPGTTYHKVKARISVAGDVRDVGVTIRQRKDGVFHYDLAMGRDVGTEGLGATHRVAEARGGAQVGPDILNLELLPVDVKDAEGAVAADLQAEMTASGLDGKVTARLVRGLTDAAGVPIQGMQRGADIAINPAAPAGALGTLRHEIVHALRDEALWGKPYGLFSQAEWRGLVAEARKRTDVMARVRRDYAADGLSEAKMVEEVVAEMYRGWAGGRDAEGPLSRLFSRVRFFLEAMGNALTGQGFQSAGLTFERIARGDVGGRGPDGPSDGRSNQAARNSRHVADIKAVIAAARAPGHAPQRAEIGKPAGWVVDAAADGGLDLGSLRHVIDGSAVRHIFKNHGSARSEDARGQIAVTDQGIASIGTVIGDPDAVMFGHRTKLGRDAVIYARVMDDGTTLVVEEIRERRGEAAVQTMWKMRSAAKDDNALTRILLSNARGDGGTGTKIVTWPPSVNASRPPQERRPGGQFAGHAVRYGRAWASQPPVTNEAALERKERGLIGQILTDAMGGISGRYNLLSLVPGRPLFNELGKAVPSAKEYLRIREEMDALRDEAMFKTEDIAQAWHKILSKEGASNRAMMDLMHDATAPALTRPRSSRHRRSAKVNARTTISRGWPSDARHERSCASGSWPCPNPSSRRFDKSATPSWNGTRPSSRTGRSSIP